jgi:hypothetical protein
VIATRRGLAILGAIALALIVALVVDLSRTRGPSDRTLVPGFDEASITRMQWTAHPVGPYLTLERTKGGPWKRTAPTPGAVEQAPIASLLATLRGARWHRSEKRDPREEVAAHLAIDGGGTHLELWIGRSMVDAEQAWIRIGDRSYLVDAWVTHALMPSPLDLAIRAPLAGIASVDAYTVDGVHIAGQPRQIRPQPRPVTASTGYLTLDEQYVGELERAIAELTIDELPPAAMGHGEALTIEMAGTRVSLGGDCDSARVYIAATTGDGCVRRERADAVRALVAKLHGPPQAIVSRVPMPGEIEHVLLVDDAKLELAKRPMIDGVDADLPAVAELMAVLRSPVEAADVVPPPTTRSIGGLAIGTRLGATVIGLYPGNILHRAEEALALRMTPAAFAILMRGASAYRDPTPWREEPTTVDEITIDNVVWKRGATLGEWARTPAGRSDAASIEALVRALAEPRVLGVAPATLVHPRRIQLLVRPPVGGEKTHMLELGDAIAAGCPAKIDGANLLLPVEICRLVPR